MSRRRQTAVPDPITEDEWAAALRGLALAVGGFAVVVACWTYVAPLVARALGVW